ncbi:metalloendopeptidase, partial [Coemansia sp. RSA 1358]
MATILNSISPKGSFPNFNLGPSEIEEMPKAVVSRTAKVFDMVAVQTNHTFESAIAPIAMNENKSKVFVDLVWLLKDVSPSKDIRDASSAAANMTNHNTEMYMREDVYEAVRTAFANEKKMDKLDSEDRRLVKKLEREFYIHGLGLDKDSRARLGEIYNRKEELKLQFNSNTNGTSSKVLFTRRELVGLSDPYVDGLKTGQVDGLLKYVVKCKGADYYLLIRLAKHPETRKKMYLAFNSRRPENISLLQELTMLRLEKARLLGKSTHAEHMLEDQMAKTPKAVFDMLNSWK